MSQSTSYTTGGVALGAPEGAPKLRDRVSWGAILAGALIAVATGAMLNILGGALGFAAVDLTGRDTPSAGSYGMIGAAWVLVSNLIGLFVGAYAAAWLSGTSDKKDATYNGLAVWGVAYLVTALLASNIISGVVNTAGSVASTAASAVGGAAQTAATAASNAAPNVTLNPQQLVERARTALSGPTDPARMTTEQRAAELTSLLGRRLAGTDFSEADRRRANQLVAAEAGIPEQEADQRIRAYEADLQRTAQEAERRAREAADATAKAASTAAFGLFFALLLGAIAAVIGARAGTREMLVVTDRRPVV